MKFLHKSYLTLDLLLAVLALTVASCGSSDKGSDAPGSPGSSDGSGAKIAAAACNPTKAVPAEITGGCTLRLVTPAPCEEIDLTNGKSYEFAWTTDGGDCETPYKLHIGGNPIDPATGGNLYTWSLSARAGQISRKGGYSHITAADLDGLTSDNGTYHWDVFGWYGSHPASQTFRVKK